MKIEKLAISLLKISFGASLFWVSGGLLLAVLGLIPLGIVNIPNIVLPAIILQIVAILSVWYVLFGIPLSIFGLTILEDGLSAFNINFGIRKTVNKGIKQIPIVNALVR